MKTYKTVMRAFGLSVIIIGTTLTGIARYFNTERIHFLKGYLKSPKTVGALTPLSTKVTDELIRYVGPERKKKQLSILEVGAGTGAVTKAIIPYLQPDDRLDLVEINPLFCKTLEKKFDHHPNVHIHCMSIVDWQPAQKYDVIISTIPFLSLEKELVQRILDHYQYLMRFEGMLSFVQYVGFDHIKQFFLFNEKEERFKELRAIIQAFKNNYLVSKVTILQNVPPIHVFHLCIH